MRGKSLSVVLAAFLTVVYVFSAYAAEPFKNTEKGYSIIFPQGWETKINESGISFALSPLAGETDTFRENVNVTTEDLPGDFSAEEYIKAAEEHLKNLPGYKRIGKGPEKDYSWIKFGHEAQGYKFAAYTVVFIKNKRAYVVTCTALDNTFDSFKAVFDKTVKTFKVLDK